MGEIICVLGGTLKEAHGLLDILCEANADMVVKRHQNTAVLNDGTRLIAVSLQDEYGFVGCHYDYIFYEKGRLTYYCLAYGLVIERLEWCCMAYSCVPNEFQWCAVDTSIT